MSESNWKSYRRLLRGQEPHGWHKPHRPRATRPSRHERGSVSRRMIGKTVQWGTTTTPMPVADFFEWMQDTKQKYGIPLSPRAVNGG